MNQSSQLLADLRANLSLINQTLVECDKTIVRLNVQVDMLTKPTSVATAGIQSLQKYIAQHKL